MDCFIGSGTTAIACKEIDRHYLGFEIDKTYYEQAINRLKGITKDDIEKINSGQMTIFD